MKCLYQHNNALFSEIIVREILQMKYTLYGVHIKKKEHIYFIYLKI